MGLALADPFRLPFAQRHGTSAQAGQCPDRIERDRHPVGASNDVQLEGLLRRRCNVAASLHLDPAERDVQIEILFCGICHSDLHSVRNEWSSIMPTAYPIVPGHEIVGRVAKVGSAVIKYQPGDLAAVGCLVDADRSCPQCKAHVEQFCPNLTFTFNWPDKHLGGETHGFTNTGEVPFVYRSVTSPPINFRGAHSQNWETGESHARKGSLP